MTSPVLSRSMLPRDDVSGVHGSRGSIRSPRRRARPLFNAVDGDDVKFRVLLANLERSLKIGGLAPPVHASLPFPPEAHDRPLRGVARTPRAGSCRDILTAVIFDRFLRRRNVFFRVARLVADLVDGDHIDGWFGLRMQSLN